MVCELPRKFHPAKWHFVVGLMEIGFSFNCLKIFRGSTKRSFNNYVDIVLPFLTTYLPQRGQKYRISEWAGFQVWKFFQPAGWRNFHTWKPRPIQKLYSCMSYKNSWNCRCTSKKKSDSGMGHVEIWFLSISAILEGMEFYQWPTLILTHTGIRIFDHLHKSSCPLNIDTPHRSHATYYASCLLALPSQQKQHYWLLRHSNYVTFTNLIMEERSWAPGPGKK